MSSTPGCHGSSRRNADLYRPGFPDEGSEGRFGRLFAVGDGGEDKNGRERLRPHASPRYDLQRLGEKNGPMRTKGQQDSRMAAGMTFLGQFVDHDITLDVQSKFEKPEINVALDNARTPNLDLDCVYGGGPEASPHLYVGASLLEGEDISLADESNPSDLPRNAVGRAVIGDPRNDENIIVGQIQGAFLRFHNRCVEHIESQHPDLSHSEVFERARDTTLHYYHRVILEDLLYHVVGVDMIHDIAGNGRRYYFPTGFGDGVQPRRPFMPVEFSVAAYRYGHSQVRDEYALNTDKSVSLFAPRGEDDGAADTLRGFQALPSGHHLEWSRFFSLQPGDSGQFAFKIDPFLPAPLLELPRGVVASDNDVTSLASRNLLRGRTFRLPSGEAIAERMAEDGALLGHDPDNGADKIVRLSNAEAVSNSDVRDLMQTLQGEYAMQTTPLWLYILIESAIHGDGFDSRSPGSGGGDRLGPVGGRIVAEVLMGLMDHFRDTSGKGLDYQPDVPYNFEETPKNDAVSIASTAAYGPRMSMCAFIDYAYAAPLADPDRVRGSVKQSTQQGSNNDNIAAGAVKANVRADEDLTV